METRPRQGRRTARVVVIGAGSRGTGYAQLIQSQDRGVIAAVAEPSAYRRNQLGKSCIWGARGADGPAEGESFTGWKEFVEYETARRKQVAGQSADIDDGRIDAALVCVLDGMHVDAVRDLAPLELHILCEKPLAPTLNGLFEIQRCLGDGGSGRDSRKVFAIGHVLRYSPVNRLLWKLVREENVVGDVVSVEHTEPVGWWHFAHSYVRSVLSAFPCLLLPSCSTSPLYSC